MKYTKPKKFNYNSVIIGGGSAGLVTSYITALLKAKVALIEKNKMGGDCLNTGCVPSKALIKSSKIFGLAKECKKLGINKVEIDFDFKDILSRVQSVIKKIEPHDSIERYESLGVECHKGEAKIKSPWEVEVNGKTLTTKNIVIASGARPFVPPFQGLNEINYVTSDTLWEIQSLPKKLVVLGGGSIGCELAQCFARFGSEVTLVERAPRLMIREDKEVSDVIESKFREEGINLLTSSTAERFYKKDGKQFLVLSQNNNLNKTSQPQQNQKSNNPTDNLPNHLPNNLATSLSSKHQNKNETEIEFDLVLIALGRKANTEDMGVKELGLEVNPHGTLKVDPYLRTTKYKNIFACGDVAGPYQFTHMASHQAWFASINSLFQPFKKFKVDYSIVPWATFTDPEVATVGHNEISAKEKNLNFETTVYSLEKNDRAVADSENQGFVKVITKQGSDKILGATIVAPRASDMLIEFISAMKNNYGLNRIMSTIHPYPSFSEANKFAASAWKQKHKPEWIFKFLNIFNKFRRS
jgi:pyruvate/2-oxoglutarate dehydrogenase complex dihydrolipoamide dehydrogenase (E3) component